MFFFYKFYKFPLGGDSDWVLGLVLSKYRYSCIEERAIKVLIEAVVDFLLCGIMCTYFVIAIP